MVSPPDEYKKGKVDLKYNLKVLWSFVRKYKAMLYAILLLILFIEIITFAENFFFKFLVDKATLFSGGQINAEMFGRFIFLTVLLYGGMILLSSSAWYFKIELINRLDGHLMSDVEQKSFWHIINLSYRFHLNKKTGSIISQFTRGVNKVESFADAFLFHFFPVFVRLALSIGVIFYFDIITAIILIIMVILFVAAGIIITHKQKIPQAIANYREDYLKQNLSDVFMNIETVKYFAKEKRTSSYFVSLSQKLRQSRLIFWNLFSWHSGIQTAILGVGIAAIFYFSFTSFLKGSLTLGSITLIYAAVWKLIPPLFGLIYGYREFMRSSVDVDALFQMFKEKNEVKDIEHAKDLKVKNGKIEYKDVHFAYPKEGKREEVIKGFSLHVPSNTKVALVGPSGSGKTTMIKLLYRLFDLDKGAIFIDGQNISSVTQHSLRENMSIVPQEPLLFDNTIYFNIAYANPKANKKDIWTAIKFAQLDRFIERLPLKENTIVGERGVKLSGGEKQRVSIARAILANRKILVLDEATSALDSQTEKEIQRDLDQLMQGRTSIIIAHRLSTIMKADMIVVMERGKIVEIGTHDQLRKNHGGLYKRLWELQQGGKL